MQYFLAQRLRCAALTLTVFGRLAFTAALAQQFNIVDLGALGGSYSEGYGLNLFGQAVGDWDPGTSPFVRAFYFHDGTNWDMTTLGGVYAVAYGINDQNRIVGESSVVGANSDIHGFVCSNGVMSDLGTLGGTYFGGYSSAHAVNASGLVVGTSSISISQLGTDHAVLWNGTTRTDLGVLGGKYSSANGINSAGVIVGETTVVPSPGVTNIHAFIYTNGIMRDLGTLGGSYSSALGINDSGIIVGESEIVQGGVTNLHAVIWKSGTMIDLGTFGGTSSSASAINSNGKVVGYSYDANETSLAFLYDGTNVLNLIDRIPVDSGWTNLTLAQGINDNGQIVGSGLLTNGLYHAFLLTPTSGANSTPVTLLQPQMLPSGQLQLTVQGTAGQTFAIQGSTNLSDWISLSTNSLSSTRTNWVDDTSPGFVSRFYRAMMAQ